MKTSSWLRLSLMLPCTLLVGGCGSTPKSTTTTYSSTNLQGNWLLAGSLPNSADYTKPGGVTVTINVDGSALTADMEAETGCTNLQPPFDGGGGGILKGTLAADGTFMLDGSGEVPPIPADVLIITGSVPETPGGSWIGTYKVPLDSTCSATSMSGAIAASTFSQVNGTFNGSTTTDGTYSSGAARGHDLPLTVSLTLQQGGTLYYLTPPVQSSFALSGSIQMQGISCFSHGTSTTTHGGVLFGNSPSIEFNMDDGSILSFGGSVVDVDSSQLMFSAFAVSGGSCEGTYLFPSPLTGTPLTLTKP